MERELKNKIVAITGGANGIGIEITEEFLKQGVKVAIIMDIDEKYGEDTVEKLTTKYGKNRATFYKCDVTKDLKQTIKKIAKVFKNIDVLINNAAVFCEDNVNKTIDINVTAVIEWTYAFMELMRTDKGGRGGTIINLASICGFRVFPYFPVYQASKYAVLGFTRCVGHQYNFDRTGVRILAICPGFTKTRMAGTIQPFEKDEQILRDTQKWIEGEVSQEAKDVGRGAVDVYLKGSPGSAWLIEGGKLVGEV